MILNRKTLTGSALTLLSILFVAVVLLSNNLFRGMRLDLTENGLYTLSTGTRHIISKLDEPIHLTLYFSDKATADSNRNEVRALRNYFERVRELLEEMNSLSNGKIHLEVIDPIPYSEAEDRASAAGLQGIPLGSSGEKIFLGLVGTNSTTGHAVIPFFEPGKEAFLEYEVAKLIQNLIVTKKSSVALLTGLNMEPGMDQRTFQMREGWASYQQLTQFFEVKTLNSATLKTVDSDINVLILVHPKNLSEEVQYAIDQFLMRGGHLLVFVDPNAETDFAEAGPNNSSDLPLLFKAWGVEYAADQSVLDRAHALPVTVSAGAPPVRHPGILHFAKKDLPHNDITTVNLDSLNFSSAGYFKMSKDSAYKWTPLLQSSDQSMLTSAERLAFTHDPSDLLNNFIPTGEHYVLAGRLQGKFKTAFPQRNQDGHLAEAKDVGEILLVADTDVLSNRLWVRIQDFFGQKVLESFADNANWFINAVDNLSGSSDLISIRGRGASSRPFTRVEKLKMAADDRFRIKEQELQQELSLTERKLVELQSGKTGDQNLLLSPAQQQELENFLKRKLEIRKELREVRRQLDAEIDTLGAWLKFINIALVPILLTLGTLGFLGWQAKHKAS